MRTFILASIPALLLASCSQPEDAPTDEAMMPGTENPGGLVVSSTRPADAIERALNDASRPESDRALDASRHPAEILDFAGAEPGWNIGEIVPGGGYYARILSTTVGEDGHVFAFNPDWVADRFADSNTALGELADSRMNMSRIVGSIETFGEGMDIPLDAVFMVLFYHDTGYDGTDRAAMNQAIFNALRPGGVFLVIDHHAPEGSGLDSVRTTHRIDASVVLEEVSAAGFVLDGESDVLANPDDPRDISVFDDSIRRQTDRFIYRFRKPE